MTLSHEKRKAPVVACLGELLIDFIAEETGTLDAAKSFRRYPGGAPANVAVGIARLGVASGFVGKVGADTFGNFLISVLKQNNVDTSAIIQTSKAPTALAFVSRSASGDRDFLFYRNPCADLLLSKTELPHAWFNQLEFLHVGGVSLTQEPSRQATIHAAKLATQQGAKVTFDPNLRLDLWANGIDECREVARNLLGYVNIFLPSREELLELMAVDDLNEAIDLAHKYGPSIICLKMGSEGSLVSVKERKGDFRQFRQLPFTVNVVDTTGAGDGYDAGLIVGLVRGLSLEEAVLEGTAVASCVITKMGAMTALPTTAELAHFFKKYKPTKS